MASALLPLDECLALKSAIQARSELLGLVIRNESELAENIECHMVDRIVLKTGIHRLSIRTSSPMLDSREIGPGKVVPDIASRELTPSYWLRLNPVQRFPLDIQVTTVFT
jgi:hypothetical protein